MIYNIQEFIFINLFESNPFFGRSTDPVTFDAYYKYLFLFFGSIVSAIIGASITIWMKKKDFKHLAANLNLQKQLFEETKSNNELKIKAELVKLEDLSRQYKLSLKRHDFDHLSKILELGDSTSEKGLMIKELANILKKYDPKTPEWVVDNYEYEEYLVHHVYSKLDYIKNECQNIISRFPNVFIELHQDFKSVSQSVSYLKSAAAEFFMLHEGVTTDIVIQDLSKSLLKLHEDFIAILEKMKEEFGELESIQRKYVREQFKIKGNKN